MDNQDIVKKEDAFEAGEYLSSAQIEIVKGRKDGPLSDQGSLLSLIDGFENANGTPGLLQLKGTFLHGDSKTIRQLAV